ncbi:MAG: lipopolysaccharide transport periplasmic protein LptA [Nitrospinae bacterium]|nr:lipopolysaccharide transport periplasmic protein LptA [Nitrospinota bacterium]
MSSGRVLWWVWMVALTLLSGLFRPISAASPAPAPVDKNSPVEVTAERMISDTHADRIIFSGNVEVRQGELLVRADRLEVTQERQSKQVSQMVATGHVHIVKGEQAATADRATFLGSEQKVVLTGNPHAWEVGSEVWGEEMVFLLAEKKMIVTGGAQRVRMHLLPGNGGLNVPAARAKVN